MSQADRDSLIHFARMNPNAPLPSEAPIRRLTKAQEKFAHLMAEGLPLAEAYRRAYPNYNPESPGIYTEAWRLSTTPHVAYKVAEIVQLNERNASALRETRTVRVLRTLEEIMNTGKTDSARIRAAELLGKAAGVFEKEKDETNSGANSLDELEKQLDEMLKRVRSE